jgi:hypothetical protein
MALKSFWSMLAMPKMFLVARLTSVMLSDCSNFIAMGWCEQAFSPIPASQDSGHFFRQRDTLVRDRSSHQQHIQKALMQMNLQLHHVFRDIPGLTARRIIDTILAGERDPQKLATLRDRRCKETEATIAAALDGNYQEEHLFELKVAVEMFDAYSLKIQKCELAGQSVLQELAGDDDAEPGKQASDWRIRGNGFSFNPQALIRSVAGHDLLSLPGLGPATVLTLISECGVDMARWPSTKHFVSWLGLSPQNKISGGRVLSREHGREQPEPAAPFGWQQFRSAEPILPWGHFSGGYLHALAKGKH